MRKAVRLGIVGAGAIGNSHLEASRLCSGVEVTAVCDVHAGRARQAAEKFGVANVFGDHRKMLAAGIVDAVTVCTPNNTHMAIAIDALQAGKDVLCEKPLAMSAQQAKRMVAAAKAAKRVLMAAQSARYSGASQFVKGLAEAGRLGDIYYGKAVWFRRDGIPKGWFQDRKQSGGGPLIDLGVHAIDLLWWLMGRPKPVSAYGVTFDRLGTTGQGMGGWGVGYNPGKFSVEDLVGAIVRFEDGRAISVDISWAAHTSDLYWLRLLGTKGGAQVQPEVVIYQTEGGVKRETVAHPGQQNAYAAETQHFAECVRKREEPISPGSQALVVMEMLDAIRASAASGRAAPVRRA
ncbi:MAG: Gfo/Idh/MocA family protein [Armatimonadota bacterium]